MEKDYYKILGLSEDDKKLNGDEFNKLCKKKYHELALKLHPDRWANGTEQEKKDAEEKFKDVAEAYDVLSDQQKRAQYDNGGMNFNFDGFDPMEMFRRMNEMDGGYDPFMGFFSRGRGGNRINKGSDIEVDVEITIEESYKGGKKDIRIKRAKPCEHCNGTGASDGKNHICSKCNGTGMETEMRQFGRGQFSMTQHQCSKCHGTGKDSNFEKCKHCKGTGLSYEYVTETIDIPRGVNDGMAFKVSGLGNAPEGDGINGDLIVQIKLKNDGYFNRPDDVNVIHYESVPFTEALLGFKKEFKCVDGSKVTVNAKELTKPGEAFIFHGKGMPDVMGRNRYGDYAVVINYELPKSLNNKQRDLLKNFYN